MEWVTVAGKPTRPYTILGWNKNTIDGEKVSFCLIAVVIFVPLFSSLKYRLPLGLFFQGLSAEARKQCVTLTFAYELFPWRRVNKCVTSTFVYEQFPWRHVNNCVTFTFFTLALAKTFVGCSTDGPVL